ncbi:hypothetical protein, partial [Bradyrhizobium sp. 23AC]
AHLRLPTLALMIGGVAVYLSAITFVRLITGICGVVVPRITAVIVLLLLIYVGQFISPLGVFAITLAVLIAEVRLEDYFSVEEAGEPSADL